ncbi:hypothetical protein AHF37_07335, partial [Paragonimus kellicotti]
SRWCWHEHAPWILVLCLSVFFGSLHWLHVTTLHENDLFYSHLSSRERELTFRTESGFYYSYFKQIILSPSLRIAWESLVHDTRTEVPRCLNLSSNPVFHHNSEPCSKLNAMQRFNLYPELILAIAYRLAHSYGLLSSECYQVTRDVPPNPIALVVNPNSFEMVIYNNVSVSLIASQTLGRSWSIGHQLCGSRRTILLLHWGYFYTCRSYSVCIGLVRLDHCIGWCAHALHCRNVAASLGRRAASFGLFFQSSRGNPCAMGATTARKFWISVFYAAAGLAVAHDSQIDSLMTRNRGRLTADENHRLAGGKNGICESVGHSRWCWHEHAPWILVLCLSVFFGSLHWLHVTTLHENDLFYSHLSSRERELTFRTESGFYYSYFKQIILSPSLRIAWESLVHDTRTEVPRCLNLSSNPVFHHNSEPCSKLNAMQRFNLYPELILAIAYRLAHSYGLLSSECYQVTRDVPPNPIALVVNPNSFEMVIYNNVSFTESIPFFYQPSDFISTSAATVYCFLLLGFQLPWQFAQFALATQVSSLFAAACVTSVFHAHEKPDSDRRNLVLLLNRIRTAVFVHLLALAINFVLQFGNGLLISSGYLAGLIGALFGLWALDRQVMDAKLWSKEIPVRRVVLSFLIWPLAVAIGLTIFSGLVITRFLYPTSASAHDGGHILDLLREKLQLHGTFRTFHTRMYTCAAEFDFIGWTSLEQPVVTGLLPASGLITFWICVAGLFRLLVRSSVSEEQQHRLEQSASVTTKTAESAEVVNQPLLDFASMFLIFQLCFFTLMAGLIMRLKLFWTPQLCLTLALLAHPTRWQLLVRQFTNFGFLCQTARRWFNRLNVTRSSTVLVAHALLILFLAYMTVPGLRNLQAEWAIHGQFSAYNDEVLLDWFQSLPPIRTTIVGYNMPWVIAGPMSTLGGLRLMLPAAAPYPTTQWSAPGSKSSVGFAFTNHPHYENAQLRERTVLAYAIYSRRSVHEVWKIYHQQLQNVQESFLVLLSLRARRKVTIEASSRTTTSRTRSSSTPAVIRCGFLLKVRCLIVWTNSSKRCNCLVAH